MNRNYDLISRRALAAAYTAITVAALLVSVGWTQIHEGRRDLADGLVDMAEVTLVVNRVVIDLASALLTLTALLLAVALLAGLLEMRNLRRAPAVSNADKPTFERSLNELVSSLADMEERFRSTERALAAVESERLRNERLVTITRVHAETVRDEIRQAALTGSRFQTRLAVAGIVLTMLVSVGIALIQQHSP